MGLVVGILEYQHGLYISGYILSIGQLFPAPNYLVAMGFGAVILQSVLVSVIETVQTSTGTNTPA